jgi:hypothetical protein
MGWDVAFIEFVVQALVLIAIVVFLCPGGGGGGGVRGKGKYDPLAPKPKGGTGTERRKSL